MAFGRDVTSCAAPGIKQYDAKRLPKRRIKCAQVHLIMPVVTPTHPDSRSAINDGVIRRLGSHLIEDR